MIGFACLFRVLIEQRELGENIVKLSFIDRIDEQKRLERALMNASGSSIVIYGRRHCGKSTLIQKISVGLDSVYYLADQQEASLQIRDLSREIDRAVPGFSAATNPAWDSVLSNLNERLDRSELCCMLVA